MKLTKGSLLPNCTILDIFEVDSIFGFQFIKRMNVQRERTKKDTNSKTF